MLSLASILTVSIVIVSILISIPVIKIYRIIS